MSGAARSAASAKPRSMTAWLSTGLSTATTIQPGFAGGVWLCGRMIATGQHAAARQRSSPAVVLVAVVVSLLAAPFAAAAVGTAVHDARSHLYAEQAQTRHAVTATVTDVHPIGAEPAAPHEVITAPARWVISGSEHIGAVKARPTVQIGDRADILVDDEGQQVDELTALSRAADDAVVAAVVIWLIVIAATAALLALIRAMLDHVRKTGWQHDIDDLLCRGGGQTNIQP